MEVVCQWCESQAKNGKNTVYWELPDGTRAIQISETPAVVCDECSMVYQNDEITKAIEDQLFLIDTNKIGKSISFDELMALPRLLKRNYFDFTS